MHELPMHLQVQGQPGALRVETQPLTETLKGTLKGATLTGNRNPKTLPGPALTAAADQPPGSRKRLASARPGIRVLFKALGFRVWAVGFRI